MIRICSNTIVGNTRQCVNIAKDAPGRRSAPTTTAGITLMYVGVLNRHEFVVSELFW